MSSADAAERGEAKTGGSDVAPGAVLARSNSADMARRSGGKIAASRASMLPAFLRSPHGQEVDMIRMAKTPEELQEALGKWGAALCADPQRRRRTTKHDAIGVAIETRAAKPDMWTKEVAATFATVLAAYTLGADEVVTQAAEVTVTEGEADDPATPDANVTLSLVFQGPAKSGGGGSGWKENPMAGTTGGGSSSGSGKGGSSNLAFGAAVAAVTASAKLKRKVKVHAAEIMDIEPRRRVVFVVQSLVLLFLLALVALSFVAGREFGAYFAANILMLLVTVVGVYITWSHQTYTKFMSDLVIIAYFVFLWGGVIMWIVFLATFKERLYSYCATASGAVRAECANPSDFLAPGIIIGVVATIAYVGFFTIMLRKMYDYSQAVEVVRHFGPRNKQDSGLRPIAADAVEGIGSYLSLGQGCAAGCYERGTAASTAARVAVAVFAMLAAVLILAAAIVLGVFCLVHLMFIGVNKLAGGKFKVACGSRTDDVSPVFGALQVVMLAAIIGLISLFVCLGGDEVACDVAEVCAFIIIVVLKLAFHSSSNDDDLFV